MAKDKDDDDDRAPDIGITTGRKEDFAKNDREKADKQHPRPPRPEQPKKR